MGSSIGILIGLFAGGGARVAWPFRHRRLQLAAARRTRS